MGVYHPPYNATNRSTPDSLLILDFADAISNLLPNHKNLIVSGDFNIHVNNVSNDDAIFLLDAMSALDFTHYVNTATHYHGNILDLIFTNTSLIPIRKCVGEFVCDHKIVLCYTKLEKPPLTVNPYAAQGKN